MIRAIAIRYMLLMTAGNSTVVKCFLYFIGVAGTKSRSDKFCLEKSKFLTHLTFNPIDIHLKIPCAE